MIFRLSPNYLSALFRRPEGITTSQYRTQNHLVNLHH